MQETKPMVQLQSLRLLNQPIVTDHNRIYNYFSLQSRARTELIWQVRCVETNWSNTISTCSDLSGLIPVAASILGIELEPAYNGD